MRKLPAASTLVFEGGRASIERYWALDYGRKRSFSSEEDMHETIREAIRKEVPAMQDANVAAAEEAYTSLHFGHFATSAGGRTP